MNRVYSDLVKIAVFALGTTFLLWLPFLLHLPNFWGIDLPAGGFEIILRNFDGLNYIIVAKSLYNPSIIAGFPQINLPPIYFASHFPGYPLLINLFSPALGYLYGMVAITLAFAVASAWAFYLMVKKLNLSNTPLWLTLVFLILPARFLIVRSVAAPETIFIFLVIVAMYFFIRGLQTGHQQDFLITGISGALAQTVKSPGILLFVALGLYCLYEFVANRKLLWKAYPLLLIPLTLLAIFFWYDKSYGDVLAYFHSGDNIHLTLPPFSVFNIQQFWVGTIWLEDLVWLYFIYTAAAIILFKKKLYPLAFFVTVFLAASMMVAHRDIARYSLPITPFAIIAFEDIIKRKEFILALVIIALAIYLFSLNFISGNTFPFYDLTSYR